MKLVIAFFFCLTLLQPWVQSTQLAQKLCRSANDCDWDQCCILTETRIPGYNGICSNPTQKGEICNPDSSDNIQQGLYRVACPCEEGLKCQKITSLDDKTPDFKCK